MLLCCTVGPFDNDVDSDGEERRESDCVDMEEVEESEEDTIEGDDDEDTGIKN